MATEYDASPVKLGRAATLRFTLPTLHSRAAARRRPGAAGMATGQVGAAARRFAASVARPPEVRRLLADSGPVRVKSFDAVSRPPRWWAPTLPEPSAADAAAVPRWSSADLPARGLQRVMGPPPSEKTHVPGRFASTMRSQTVNVRRPKEVAEIGTLATGAPKLTTPVRRTAATHAAGSHARGPADRAAGHGRSARSGAGPGHAPGDGEAHRAEPGAVPRAARGFTGRGSRPPSRALERTSVLRRAWAGGPAVGTGSATAPVPAAPAAPAATSWSPSAPTVRRAPASIAPAAVGGPPSSPAASSPAPSIAAPPSARPGATAVARPSGVPGEASGSASAAVDASTAAGAGSAPAAGPGPSTAPAPSGASSPGRIVAVPRPSPGGVLRRLLGRSRPAMASAAALGASPATALGGLSQAVSPLPGPDSPRDVRVRRFAGASRPPTGFAPRPAPVDARPVVPAAAAGQPRSGAASIGAGAGPVSASRPAGGSPASSAAGVGGLVPVPAAGPATGSRPLPAAAVSGSRPIPGVAPGRTDPAPASGGAASTVADGSAAPSSGHAGTVRRSMQVSSAGGAAPSAGAGASSGAAPNGVPGPAAASPSGTAPSGFFASGTVPAGIASTGTTPAGTAPFGAAPSPADGPMAGPAGAVVPAVAPRGPGLIVRRFFGASPAPTRDSVPAAAGPAGPVVRRSMTLSPAESSTVTPVTRRLMQSAPAAPPVGAARGAGTGLRGAGTAPHGAGTASRGAATAPHGVTTAPHGAGTAPYDAEPAGPGAAPSPRDGTRPSAVPSGPASVAASPRRRAPRPATRGPVVLRSMTGSRPAARQATSWPAAPGAVAPVARRLIESAPVGGPRAASALHHAAVGGGPPTGAAAAAPTTVAAAGVPRATVRPHGAASFAPGTTAALASARVAGLPVRREQGHLPAEAGGSFRIRRLSTTATAPEAVRTAAAGWIATAPGRAPVGVSAQRHTAATPPASTAGTQTSPVEPPIRRAAARLAVQRLPLRTATATPTAPSSATAPTAAQASGNPTSRSQTAPAAAHASGSLASRNQAPAAAAASAASAASTAPQSPQPHWAPPADMSAGPVSVPQLRRFSETTSGTAGAISPMTVRLMREAPVLLPAGLVSRAPGTAAAGVSEPDSAATPAAAASAVPAAARPAAPPAPESALPENSVIRRFFGAKSQAPAIGSHRGSAAPAIGSHRGPAGPAIGSHRGSGAPAIGAHRGAAPSMSGRQPTVVDADPAPVDQPLSTRLSSREWAELVDIVTRRIEDRVTAELARRGRRNVPRPM